jgi:hypothetical protein
METAQLEQEIKKIKDEILGAVNGNVTKVAEMQRQLDALDVKLAERHAAGIPDQPLAEALRAVDGLERFMQNKSGSFAFQLDAKQVARIFERKTVIDSAAVGAAVSGVLQIDRTSGIVIEARQALSIRSVLSARPTTMQLIDFIKVNSRWPSLLRRSRRTPSGKMP